MIWGLIFVGLIAAYGLWGDIERGLRPRQAVLENGRIEVPRRADGHFYVTAQVNGRPVTFVIDTGATDIVLTRADAARVGIDMKSLAFVGSASTANGRVRTAPARVDSLSLGGVVDKGVRVYVNGGTMSDSLLGMAYLRRFSKIEIAGDTLVLNR
jgi:aspartyl protease family protein